MVTVAVPPSREVYRGNLYERACRWSDARVTFDRVTDVTPHCPRCEGLLVRRMGPGVICSTCGRLWLVRELLEREAGRAPVGLTRRPALASGRLRVSGRRGT
jgi:hypothetical protein